jgi:hypothetical protein
MRFQGGDDSLALFEGCARAKQAPFSLDRDISGKESIEFDADDTNGQTPEFWWLDETLLPNSRES